MATRSRLRERFGQFWRWWQEADALRGLVGFLQQIIGFASKWWQTAVPIILLLGGSSVIVLGALVAHWYFILAAVMFVVGLILTFRLLRTRTVDIHPPTLDTKVADQAPHASPESSGIMSDRSHERKQLRQPARFIDRFGASWGMHLVPQSFLFAPLNEILNAPSKWRVSGPYCLSDTTRLKFKDNYGVRELMDGDDVGGSGGRLYCPTCHHEFRPDEDYEGERRIETYRAQVERELNR